MYIRRVLVASDPDRLFAWQSSHDTCKAPSVFLNGSVPVEKRQTEAAHRMCFSNQHLRFLCGTQRKHLIRSVKSLSDLL